MIVTTQYIATCRTQNPKNKIGKNVINHIRKLFNNEEMLGLKLNFDIFILVYVFHLKVGAENNNTRSKIGFKMSVKKKTKSKYPKISSAISILLYSQLGQNG